MNTLGDALLSWVHAAREAVRWHQELGDASLPVPEGYTPPPLGRVPLAVAQASQPQVPTGSPGTVARADAPAPSQPAPSQPAPSQPAPSQPAPSQPGQQPERPAPVDVQRPSVPQADSPAEALRLLDEAVQSCDACPLSESRRVVVGGTGPLEPALMIIGDHPRADDESEHRPFAGADGVMLDRMLVAMGLSREAVYLVNIVRCRPPMDDAPGLPHERVPKRGEVEACRHWLEATVDHVRPRVIVTMGGFAAKALLQSAASSRRSRGRWHTLTRPTGDIPVMPTLHPAFLAVNPQMKRGAWDDLQKVMARLGLSAPSRGGR
jgi:DNA polymerase